MTTQTVLENTFGFIAVVLFCLVAVKANFLLLPHLDRRRGVHVQHGPWYVDSRLFFYTLAIVSALLYAGVILATTFAFPHSNLRIATTVTSDAATFFVVATYMSLVAVVILVLVEAILRHQSRSAELPSNHGYGTHSYGSDEESNSEASYRCQEDEFGQPARAAVYSTPDMRSATLRARVAGFLSVFYVATSVAAIYIVYFASFVAEVIASYVRGIYTPIGPHVSVGVSGLF